MNPNIDKNTAFQVIAKMWMNEEFKELNENDPLYKMTMTFASYLDMMANQAEGKKKNVKKG